MTGGGITKTDVLVIILLLTAVILINPLLKAATGVKTPLAVVRGTSMLPLFRKGDIVIIVKKPPNEIKPGDVVVYKSIHGNRLIIHRVIAVLHINGEYEYVTKGDNNPFDDSFLFEYPQGRGVPYCRIVGVVWRPFNMDFKIPLIGALALLFKGR